MGESFDEKMGESVTIVPSCLQESVSFGRFEHDSLCWERWSTFPTNKYLEEVEKCSTPGSVAQKKAYFEAHYKKIAARKAELMDEEKLRAVESLSFDDPSCGVSDDELVVERSGFVEEVSDDVVVDVDVVEEECKVVDFIGEVSDVDVDVLSDKEVVDLETEVCERVDEGDGGDEVFEEKDVVQLQPDVATEDLWSEKSVLKLNEPDFVKEEVASVLVFQDKEEDKVSSHDNVEEREMVKSETKDVVIVETPKKTQKVTSKTNNSAIARKKTATPTAKGSVARMPKKSAAPSPKSPMVATPKLSKPVQSKTLMSATRSSVRKENGFTPLSTKKASTARPENKRVVPTSLHMSLSLGPTNSDPTTRKSLIMESMGDKDIVKRAFKAFEKSNLLSSRSPATNQPVTKNIEQKGSGPSTLPKKNEGSLRSAKVASPSASQQGTVKALPSPGSRRTIGVDLRNGKSIPSFGSRSLNLGSKQKEVSKRLEQKPMTKEISKAHLPSKVTLDKATEFRRPSPSTNAKVNLSSSYNLGRASKVLLKEDAKTKASG